MTKKELVIIRIGIFLILLTIIFPPWKMTIAWESFGIEYSKNYSYHPIFFPPTEDRYNRAFSGSIVDIPRLLMLWTAIVSVCGYFILIPRLMKSKNINYETAKEE